MHRTHIMHTFTTICVPSLQTCNNDGCLGDIFSLLLHKDLHWIHKNTDREGRTLVVAFQSQFTLVQVRTLHHKNPNGNACTGPNTLLMTQQCFSLFKKRTFTQKAHSTGSHLQRRLLTVCASSAASLQVKRKMNGTSAQDKPAPSSSMLHYFFQIVNTHTSKHLLSFSLSPIHTQTQINKCMRFHTR